jgi:uncharacterized membrane protein YeaQ/YmgE (transglycosylase-associated protein family)
MSIGTIVCWMLSGLIVGFLARRLIAKRLNMSLIQTLTLGVVGAVVGGLFFSMIQGTPTSPFSLSGNAWHGWIVAIVGGIVALWGYAFLYPDPS